MLPLIAELTPGTFAILAVVGLMTCMLLVRTQRQLKSGSGSHSHAKAGEHAPARQAARDQTQATRQLEQWEVRMHDLARELSAQLDSKMVAVELLVREAQEQIARFERLTRMSGQAVPPPSGEIQQSEPAAPAHLGTQAAALPRSPQRPHLLAAARNTPRRHQEVYALADAGQSSAAIAQQLGSPIGEVELILGLRRDQPAG
jgi:hypothetical protein